jgi:DMSO/TMAO reductase YedYZ molybdopterin-dependent catalytic subunit
LPILPPGQIETKRFPIVGERAPSTEVEEWHLTVEGLVHNPRTLGFDDFLTLDHREITFDIHCVTSWTRFDSTFTGVPLAEMIDPAPGACFVSFEAFSDRNHHTSLPVDYALANSWVVSEFEGEPLAAEHGGPVRVVTPGKYFYKSIKWLKSIELLTEDRPGWWEVNSSYHNNADPFAGDQRFTTGSLRPEQLHRFKDAANLDKYRGRVMIGLELRDWSPATNDLRRLFLKNCDMRQIALPGADMRQCNLSLSNLSGANLAGVHLAGSDLEGADFTDADLTGADLSGTALSATRFDGASVAGARFDEAWGLIEHQVFYLQSQGVNLDRQ